MKVKFISIVVARELDLKIFKFALGKVLWLIQIFLTLEWRNNVGGFSINLNEMNSFNENKTDIGKKGN